MTLKAASPWHGGAVTLAITHLFIYFSPNGKTKKALKSMAKIVTFLGYVLLLVGAAWIVIGLAGIAMTQGLWAAIQMLSPFNIVNFIATIITLAPGFALIVWGEKLKEK